MASYSSFVRTLCVAVIFAFSFTEVAVHAQVTAGKPGTSEPGKPADTSSSTKPGTPPPAPAVPKPPSDAKVNDYIPCLLDPAQLARLHGQAPPKYLNKAGAQDVEKAISAVLDDLATNKIIGASTHDGLKTKLTENVLNGSDASQAGDKVRDAVKTVLAQPAQADALLTDANKTIAADAIVGAAVEALNKNFEAPPDVACSMSLLTYSETSDIFGLRVAKDYVAVQVIVRNLNQQDEYLLHDVQLAVDTDPCGSFSQFEGGRDRLLVRAVALRNQFTDPRNWAVRILEGVGTVASTAVGFASRDYSLGLGVYNGVTPAVKAIFPDYTVDQLNRLSDLAFTSSGQTRTVVGKNGVVMFVTFFPAKPLEQSWWIKDAGAIPTGSSPASGTSDPACMKETTARKEHFKDKTVMSDWKAATQDQPARKKTKEEIEADKAKDRDDKKLTEAEQPIFDPKPVAYSRWKADALLEFRRHTFVAVAGVHIAQEDDLKPDLDELTCPEKDGVLDLSQSTTTPGTPVAAPAAGGTPPAAGPAPAPATSYFVCPVKGKNLDKVTRFRLRDATESTDTTVADGTMTIKTGDSTQGTVTFNLKDMKALTGDTYNVFWMDKTNVENLTGQVLKLAPSTQPAVTNVKSNELTKATIPAGTQTLKLTGTNLDKVKGFQLLSATKVPTPLPVSKATATELDVTYTSATLSSLSAGDYTLVLILADGTSVNASADQTLTLQ
jgi:hypothetical protein